MEKVKILIVEDESIVAMDMANRLHMMGHEVVGTAASGEEAIAVAGRTFPGLVLMDIKLKGEMDGVEAADAMKRRFGLPVIFITAFADEKTLSRAKVTDAFGYILKPFQERELMIAIEMALFKHRAEIELRRSRKLLDSALNSLSQGVVVTDSSGLIGFANRAAEKLSGGTAEGLVGHSFEDSFSFVYRPDLALLLEAEEQSVNPTAEWMLLKTRGEKALPVERIRTPLMDEDFKEFGTVWALRDISALARVEEFRNRLSSIVENADDPIFSTDTRFIILSWNRGAERTYGWTVEEMIGSPLEDILPDRYDIEEYQNLMTRIANGKKSLTIESSRRAKDGTILTVEATVSPIYGPDGTIKELSVIERDITAQREYEESLKRARTLAEEANRAKSEFLANVSHELRTPLNSIIGMTDLVAEEVVDTTQKEYLGIARESADSLLELIDSILDFSRIEIGAIPLVKNEFDIRSIVRASINRVSSEVKKKGLELTFSCDSSVPERFLGDQVRIGQVISNLLSNAVKFTERGSITITAEAKPVASSVSSQVSSSSSLLNISVADTGIGIPEDRLEFIFDKFTQVDGSSTRKYGGVGIGLALARGLASQLGGTLTVSSEPGKGSTFVFSLSLVNVTPVASVHSDVLSALDIIPGEKGGQETTVPETVASLSAEFKKRARQLVAAGDFAALDELGRHFRGEFSRLGEDELSKRVFMVMLAGRNEDLDRTQKAIDDFTERVRKMYTGGSR